MGAGRKILGRVVRKAASGKKKAASKKRRYKTEDALSDARKRVARRKKPSRKKTQSRKKSSRWDLRTHPQKASPSRKQNPAKTYVPSAKKKASSSKKKSGSGLISSSSVGQPKISRDDLMMLREYPGSPARKARATAKGKATRAKNKAAREEKAENLRKDKNRAALTKQRLEARRAAAAKKKINIKKATQDAQAAKKATAKSKRRYQFRSDPYESGSPRAAERAAARAARKREIQLEQGNKKTAAQKREAAKAQRKRKRTNRVGPMRNWTK